ncbi:YfgM family protein [Actinobacillus arthritidis]|uniref:YfgM family protein n=1 Tax=Actinobacillus arthritidis TaxID=157339 RepID=UPI00244349D0|nr:tetratricopeptide repeat protein [Actinobacillus arthritidis]WGE88723.1 tetratricopeptide repeat protein [Actinobacillus arthritidis]
MSNEYLNKTEEQQFEEAKSWFKENGTPIVVAVFIACATTFGWNFWKNHQLETAQQTSAAYQNVMESYLQDPAKNTPLVEKFISENKDSSYAVFSQLESAKQAVEKADFATAKTTLQNALTATSDVTLQTLIRFRLAMIDYQLKGYDDALATLGQITDQVWEQRKLVLTGDILVAKGDKASAKGVYEKAKSIASSQDKLLIDVRLNNL